MIQVNRDHSYVYVKKDFGQSPEDFKKELDGAVYKLDGNDVKLKFDGKVEDSVIGKLGDQASKAITDMKTLAKSLGAFKAAQPALDKGEKAEIELSNGDKWTGARQKSNPKAHSNYEYTFTDPQDPAQTVTFTDDKRVKLHTEASGGKLAHEAVGKMYFAADSNGKYKNDSIFYLSESVRSK